MAKGKIEPITEAGSADVFKTLTTVAEVFNELIGEDASEGRLALALHDVDQPIAREQYAELLNEDRTLLGKTLARVAETHVNRGWELPSMDEDDTPAEADSTEESETEGSEQPVEATA